MNNILAVLSSGACGAILGYLFKTLIDHQLQKAKIGVQRSSDVKKAVELSRMEDHRYQDRYFYAPLSRSIERLASRLDIALSGKWKEFSYEPDYVEDSFLYELCALCFWLEVPTFDPKLTEALKPDKESILRSALRITSGFERYKQKEVGGRMKSSDSSVFGPISYAEFRSKKLEIISGKSNQTPIQIGQELRTIPSRLIKDVIMHEVGDDRVVALKAEYEKLLHMAIKFEEYASQTEEYVK